MAGSAFIDSLVGEYIAEQDSMEFNDPSFYTAQVLKAYYARDTAFFHDMQQKRDMAKGYLYPANRLKCPMVRPLRDLGADEAYRFFHGQSFCLYTEAVTIYKTGDTIRLQYVAYLPPSDDGQLHLIQWSEPTKDSIVDNYLIRKSFQKVIRERDWTSLKEALEKTDYWGLKTADHRILLDGSYWNVQAFLKEPDFIDGQRTHQVIRNSPVLQEFRDLGKLFLTICGEKPVCGTLD